MIRYLKKGRHSKTPKRIENLNFKKPIIKIIDDDVDKDDDNVDKNNNDNDDDVFINVNKISKLSKSIKPSPKAREEFKKSLMTNASVVKEILLKTVEKHKIELCTQMATQLVDIYKNKHKNDDNDDNNDNNDNDHDDVDK